jgi:hypothetical protein
VAIVAGGVPAGATIENQPLAAKPGSAASAMVGRSGAWGERVAVATLNAFTRPARRRFGVGRIDKTLSRGRHGR